MLQDISDKLRGQRWLAYSLVGVLGLVFAAWIPSGVIDFGFGGSSQAAKVNGEVIPAAEMMDLWQRQQSSLMAAYGGSLTDEQRTQFQDELLNASIRELATTQYARKLGFGVSRAQLSQAFREEEAFQIDGQFDVRVAQSRLAAAGFTEAAYVEDLRRRLLGNQLLGVIGISDFVTPAEGRRILGLLDEEREVRYLLLEPEAFAGSAPVDDAAIEAWYQAHADDFRVPESVRLAYAELSLADMRASAQVTEEQLRGRYEQTRSSYVSPETRRARHILITVDGETDDAQAAARAQDLYQRIQGGADFAALAREFSKDTASAARGGDLDWAVRDVYVPEFADKLFTMQQGEVSEPVKTQYGYHIIGLDGIRPESGRSFDEVRPELTARIRDELALGHFYSRQDQLQERLEHSGAASLDQLVGEFGLRRGEVEHFERGAGGLPLGSDAALNREVFSDASLTQRRIGGPVPLGEDRILIFQVQDHSPAGVQPLAEVRDQVVAALIRERGAEAALEAAHKAVEQLGDGRSFDQVAASLRLRAEPARYVGRGSPELPVEVRDAVFQAPRPAPGQPVREALKVEGGGAAVVEVTATRVQPLSDLPQLQELRTRRELARYTRRDIEAYLAQILRDAKVRRNPQAFQQ